MGALATKVEGFNLRPGQMIGGKYVVEEFLGGGLEGEVYRVSELRTGIRRAAKLFYPQENVSDRAARAYARKLDRLRDCPVVIHYHHAETVRAGGARVTCLFSDFVEGWLLADYVENQPGRRLQPFEALHLIYTIAKGLEQIHAQKEYHGDLHAFNILIKPRGIFFDVKIVDFYYLGRTSSHRRRQDVVDLVRLLYEITGGRRWYARQPPVIKAICRGMRRDLITRAFPTARHLREYLETFPGLTLV
ncbi:MAG TPA: protein kinase [Kiloniellales bacterium]|nr:protein kinase [Kiloniellales bacterium]